MNVSGLGLSGELPREQSSGAIDNAGRGEEQRRRGGGAARRAAARGQATSREEDPNGVAEAFEQAKEEEANGAFAAQESRAFAGREDCQLDEAETSGPAAGTASEVTSGLGGGRGGEGGGRRAAAGETGCDEPALAEHPINPISSMDDSVISDVDSGDVLRVFRRFDLNDDGVVSHLELSRILKRLDPVCWTDAKIQAFLATMDANGDGVVQYEEFLDWIFESPTQPTEWRQLRMVKSGILDKDESSEPLPGLRVATFDLNGGANTELYAEFFQQAQPPLDFLALQKVPNFVAAAIAKALKMSCVWAPAAEYGNAILHRAEAQNSRRVRLNEDSAAICTVQVPIPEGDPIDVIAISARLHASSEGARQQQIRDLLRQLGIDRPLGYHPRFHYVLLGHLNSLRRRDFTDAEWREQAEKSRSESRERPQAMVMELIERTGFKDAALGHPAGPSELGEEFRGPAITSRSAQSRIDWIMFRGLHLQKAREYEVLPGIAPVDDGGEELVDRATTNSCFVVATIEVGASP